MTATLTWSAVSGPDSDRVIDRLVGKARSLIIGAERCLAVGRDPGRMGIAARQATKAAPYLAAAIALGWRNERMIGRLVDLGHAAGIEIDVPARSEP